MPHFLSHIFKEKKIISLVVLVFMLGGIVAPTIAKADYGLETITSIADAGLQIVVPPYGAYKQGSKAYNNLSQSAKDKVSEVAGATGDAVVSALLSIPIGLSGFFSFLGTTLLNAVITLAISNTEYTKNGAVNIGWPIVRGLANMVIVISLIAIALAMILRLEMFGDRKKALVKLIIAALLINFSLVICGIVIDASNIFMKYALYGGQKSGGTTVADFISKNELETFKELLGKAGSNPSTLDSIARAAGTTFFFAMKGAISFLFAFLFLFRIFALWILVILSPLAFASVVLPQTKSMIFDKWINNFLQWCFIGGIGAMFIYIGNQVHAGIGTYPGFRELLNGPDKAIGGILAFLVPGMFLVMGFIASMQISAMGASGALKASRWINSKAIGAAKGLAKGSLKAGLATGKAAGGVAGNIVGAQGFKDSFGELYGQIRYGIGRFGEKAGLTKAGTANKNFQDRQAAKIKPYTELAEAEKNSDVIADRAQNGKSAAERAAYTKVLSDRKKLSKIDPSKRQEAINNAEKHGIDTSKFAEADYRYAEFDKKTIDRIRATNPRLTLAQAKAAARQEQLEASLPSMSGEQIRNIDKEDITADLVTSKSFTANIARKFKTADRAHINALRDPAIRKALKDQIAAAKAAGNKAEVNRLKNIRKEIRDLP